MAKPFSIHDWQAQQRRLNEQEDSETGNTSDETLSPLEKLVERVVAVMDGRLATWQNTETIQSSHDMMALMKRDKEKIRQMVYNLLRDDFKDLKETNMTGTGASFNAGNSMAHFGKSKKKRENTSSGDMAYTQNVSEQEEEEELTKDAEKIKNHPLLGRINTRQEWAEVMQSVLELSANIPQVSISAIKEFLLDALKNVKDLKK